MKCGAHFSLVVTEIGEVHGFGANESGQLGRPTPAGWDAAPELVQGMEAVRIRAVSGAAAEYKKTRAGMCAVCSGWLGQVEAFARVRTRHASKWGVRIVD